MTSIPYPPFFSWFDFGKSERLADDTPDPESRAYTEQVKAARAEFEASLPRFMKAWANNGDF